MHSAEIVLGNFEQDKQNARASDRKEIKKQPLPLTPWQAAICFSDSRLQAVKK